MNKLTNLLDQNKKWAQAVSEREPGFFEKLSHLQAPEYLWIGCSDSRITPATSLGLLPGEMFVHRNIANLVIHTDLSCLSVLQFAVEVLKVKHIIVCGHYGCGGVKAALDNTQLGLIDNWLRHIQDLIYKHRTTLESADNYEARLDKLCEINVIEQVIRVGESTLVREAWKRGQDLTIHGWIYYIIDGIYRDLEVSVASLEDLDNLKAITCKQPKELEVGKGK